MARAATPTTIAGYLAIAPVWNGLNPGNYVPAALQSQAATVAARNVPVGANAASFNISCTSMLIARGIIFAQDNAICGAESPLDLTNSQITGEVGQTVVGIASIAGTALPGIGVAVSAIQQIFAAHAQAVANEEATICRVAGILNQVIPYYDNLVRLGKISPGAAVAGMQTYLNQVNGLLQQIFKKCNASCYVMGWVSAHADFAASYYPEIAPIQVAPKPPASAPITIAPTAPGQPPQVGAAPPIMSAPIVNSVAGVANAITAPVAAATGINISSTELLLGGGVLLVILLAVFLGEK